MVGGELQLPDKKVPLCNITCFEDPEKTVYSVYDDIPPLSGPKREYLGYRACVVGELNLKATITQVGEAK